MSRDLSSSILKHKRVFVLAIAIAVISVYVIPFDHLAALAKKSDPPGKDDGNEKNKEKNNNCENGLPPHKNGKSDNGNHYGCLKHL